MTKQLSIGTSSEMTATFKGNSPKEAFRYDFGTVKYHYYEFHVEEGGPFVGTVLETNELGGTWTPVFRFKELKDHCKIGLNGYRYSKFVGESPNGGILRQFVQPY